MKNDGMDKLFGRIYGLVLGLMAFTGFGNMPLWKRYYIADLPGMAWSGHFFRNVQVHYITGAILLALAAYFSVSYYMALRNRGFSLARTGAIRAILLGLALFTGILMALKNLPSFNFSMEVLITMNFLHMGSALFLLFFSLGCLVTKSPWTKRKE